MNAARKAFCVPRGEGGSFGRSSKEEVWIDPLSVVSTGHCGQYVATVSSKERKEKENKKRRKQKRKTDICETCENYEKVRNAEAKARGKGHPQRKAD